MNAAQAAEVAKYEACYQNPGYRMSEARRNAVARALVRVAPGIERISLLDVGTGRGETLDLAASLDFSIVHGTETVEDLIDARENVDWALAWALPYDSGSFQTVTCFDVMEHLLPSDAEPTIRELARVASKRLILTISNLPSSMGDGVELHVNRRPYEAWDTDLRAWLAGWRVEWLKSESNPISEMWEATR